VTTRSSSSFTSTGFSPLPRSTSFTSTPSLEPPSGCSSSTVSVSSSASARTCRRALPPGTTRSTSPGRVWSPRARRSTSGTSRSRRPASSTSWGALAFATGSSATGSSPALPSRVGVGGGGSSGPGSADQRPSGTRAWWARPWSPRTASGASPRATGRSRSSWSTTGAPSTTSSWSARSTGTTSSSDGPIAPTLCCSCSRVLPGNVRSGARSPVPGSRSRPRCGTTCFATRSGPCGFRSAKTAAARSSTCPWSPVTSPGTERGEPARRGGDPGRASTSG
jgi:mating pheromone-induced death protein 2